MFRITRETDYGIALTACMAQDSSRSHSAKSLAHASHLPQPTVSKILKLLTRAGLLTSQRGVKGGYSLVRPPAQISVADVIDALEGPIALTECNGSELPECVNHCTVSGHWLRINHAVREALERISLLEMSRPHSIQHPLHYVKDLSTAHPTFDFRRG